MYKRNRRPIEIIDKMLSRENSPRRNKREVRAPNRYSPQVSRTRAQIADKSVPSVSGICPGCDIFVEGTDDDDDGVVCAVCNAYWHFNCAEVSKEVLENEWDQIEFVCKKHRKISEDGVKHSCYKV